MPVKTKGRVEAEGEVYSYKRRFRAHGGGRNLPGVSGLRVEVVAEEETGVEVEVDEEEVEVVQNAFVPSIFRRVEGEVGYVGGDTFVPSIFGPAVSTVDEEKEAWDSANREFSEFLGSGMRKRK